MNSSTQIRTSANIADSINEAHLACCKSASDALTHAMRCGDLLAEAKSACQHGTWQMWLSDNFQASSRTARGYMRLAANRDKIESKRQGSAVLGIEAAMQLVATPRPTPQINPDKHQDDNSLAKMLAEPKVRLSYCFNRGHKLAQLTPYNGESDYYHVAVFTLPHGVATETQKAIRRDHVARCLKQMEFTGDDWQTIDKPILEPTPLTEWWKMEGLA